MDDFVPVFGVELIKNPFIKVLKLGDTCKIDNFFLESMTLEFRLKYKGEINTILGRYIDVCYDLNKTLNPFISLSQPLDFQLRYFFFTLKQ